MELKEIGSLINTQDNRITDHPIFVVEKSVMVITDGDYHYDKEEWVNTESGDYEVASETKSKRLNLLEEGCRDTGDWKKFYLLETWQFVTACFTEQGCKDFLAINGHNIGRNRIYAYGSFRNKEYQTVRNYLMDKASKEPA
ncbi:hypothetical protein [Endozoicomonas arenosclerae]|uniref:hypothetical protein n=1 Tax=Endozoicomonas arenosclerae TaxID=1633495 RepID=UPI000780AE09|nr:hypothetical protein [Endozoicomonas arenosclerae]